MKDFILIKRMNINFENFLNKKVKIEEKGDIYINGFPFNIYTLDNRETIIERIAALFNSLPKYIIFPINFNFPETIQGWKDLQSLSVTNILQMIKDAGVNEFLPSIFVKELLKNNLITKDIDLLQDIIIPFVLFGKDLPRFDKDTIKLLLFQINLDVKKILNITSVDFVTVYNDKSEYLKKIHDSISYNKAKSSTNVSLIKKFEAITEGVRATDFLIEKVMIEHRIKNTKQYDIMDIFDLLTLNQSVPFASIGEFYKVINNFDLSSFSWFDTLDEVISIKVSSNKEEGLKSRFSETYIQIEDDDIKIMIIKYNSKFSLNEKELIDQLNKIFPQDINVSGKGKNTNFSGVFYFPKQTFNNIIMSDMILNNTLFSHFFQIDESNKPLKHKNSIYIYFYNGLTATITEKIAKRKDEIFELLPNDPDVLDVNDYYLRIRLHKISKLEEVINFKDILSKFFVLYETEKLSIIEFYQKYIPNFEVFTNNKKKTIEVKLKNINPELFLPGYPKKCPNPPVIIENKEEDSLTVSSFLYPKNSHAAEIGSKQFTYLCQNPKFPFIGLRDNPLPNSETFPFLPCCYSSNQMDAPGSKYREYFFNENSIQVSQNPREVITSNKLLNPGNYGVIPLEISSLLLFSFSPEKLSQYKTINYNFLRIGVSRNKNSFINCVCEAILRDKNILSSNENDRNDQISRVRKSFAQPKLIPLCKQHMYDYSTDEIKDFILDEDKYFDPKYFVSLLSYNYSCNIFVFSKEKNGKAKLSIPRFTKGFYQQLDHNENTKNILIYEHYGSNSDGLDYPQCELLCEWINYSEIDIPSYMPQPSPRKKDTLALSFTLNDSGLVEIVKKFYYKLIESSVIISLDSSIINKFNIRKEVILTDVNFPLFSENNSIKVLSQTIDMFGKCRMLSITFMNMKFDIFTSPIMPLGVEEKASFIVNRINLYYALEFIRELNGIIIGQVLFTASKTDVILSDRVSEVIFILGSVIVNIPILLDKKPNIMEIEVHKTSTLFSNSTESNLSSYNTNNSTVRYLKEIVFYLYSIYLEKERKKANIQQFIKENIMIGTIDYFTKPIVRKIKANTHLFKNNKLILPDVEIRDRLIGLLKIEIESNSSTFDNYHKSIYIRNFYMNINDFKLTNSNQIIVFGRKNIEIIFNKDNIDHVIHDSIQYVDSPYFLRNNLIGKDVYMAQNIFTDIDLHESLWLLYTWLIEKYNTVFTQKVIEPNNDSFPYSFYAYHYLDKDNISEYFINMDDGVTEDPIYKIIYLDNTTSGTIKWILLFPITK